MGIAYQNGEGVERDLDKAAYWYGKAVEQGNGLARIALDYMRQCNGNCKSMVGWNNFDWPSMLAHSAKKSFIATIQRFIKAKKLRD